MTNIIETFKKYNDNSNSSRQSWDDLKVIIKDTAMNRSKLINKERKARQAFLKKEIARAKHLGTENDITTINYKKELNELTLYTNLKEPKLGVNKHN